MIEVRIRRSSDIKALHLCDVMIEDIDKLFALIKAWGIPDCDADELYGQFVIDTDAAYFELVVGDE